MKKLITLTGLLAVCLLWSQSALAAHKLEKISDRIYFYSASGDHSPENAFGANAGIIIGDKGVLVIDTLVSAGKAKGFIKAIRSVTDKPIRWVLNTHFHFDHTFGNSEFAKLGATIITHEKSKAYQAKWSPKLLKNAKAWLKLDPETMVGTEIVLPDQTFSQNMVFDLGGISAEVINLAHSHTQGSVFVHVPSEKVIFTGDVLFTERHPNMSAADVPGWVKVLDHITEMDLKTIVPGHGPLSTKKDLVELKDYLQVFEKKARELVTTSDDIKAVAAKMAEFMPHRPHGVSTMASTIKWKYMREKKAAQKK